MTAKWLAILCYHKVGEPPAGGWKSWYYVPEEAFTRHLTFLRDEGWQILDGATLLAGLRDPGMLPERGAVITFDDAYRSTRSVAAPLLERFGFPSILFVPTDHVGETNKWDHGIESDEALCDWDDLRALQDAGVSIQSHGRSHRRLSELSPEQREDELVRSKSILEGEMSSSVELFSFPYGDDAEGLPAIRSQLAAAGYRAACLFGGGVMKVPVSDAFELERVPIGSDSDVPALLAVSKSVAAERTGAEGR